MKSPDEHRREDLDTLHSELRVIEQQLALPAGTLSAEERAKCARQAKEIRERIAAMQWNGAE